jgi:hypothetical protein
MRYEYTLTNVSKKGRLIYSSSDLSFDTHPEEKATLPTAAILVGGTLQLEFYVETGELLRIWGYSPDTSWRRGQVAPPHSKPGTVRVVLDEDAVSDVSYEDKNLKDGVTFDKESGWLLIGSADYSEALEIMQNVVLGFDGEKKLVSVLLHPLFEL